MSGLAGWILPGKGRSAVELAGIETTFAGPNHDGATWGDEDFAVAVAGRFDRAGTAGDAYAGSWAEILAAPDLVLAGEGFWTNLDDLSTEVAASERPTRAHLLLELFRRHGERLGERLHGAYNLVVWDRREKKAFLSTCKFGQRNLYYAELADGLLFGSQVRTVLRLRGGGAQLATEMLRMNLLCGSVHGPGTMIAGIQKYLPGAGGTFHNGVHRASLPDFSWCDVPETTLEAPDLVGELDRCLERSMTRQAALGERRAVMLSSGVDSSLVSAYLKKVTGRLTTITQAMPGEMDESQDAAIIAQALGSDHHTLRYDPGASDLVEDTRLFVRILEEPNWAQLGIPLIHFSHAAQEHAGSIFTGTMAGFLFGKITYDDATGDPFSIYNYVPRPTNDYLIKKVITLSGSDPDDYVRRLLPQLSERPLRRQVLGVLMLEGMLLARLSAQVAQHFAAEALFPLVDDGVVRLSASLPATVRSYRGRSKWLLYRLLEEHIPKNLVPQVKRPYWGYPLLWCYERGLLGSTLDLLSERRTLERGLYDRATLKTVVARYRMRAAEARWHPILWQLLTFEIFCREYLDA